MQEGTGGDTRRLGVPVQGTPRGTLKGTLRGTPKVLLEGSREGTREGIHMVEVGVSGEGAGDTTGPVMGVEGMLETKSPLPLHLEVRPVGIQLSLETVTGVELQATEPMNATPT